MALTFISVNIPSFQLAFNNNFTKFGHTNIKTSPMHSLWLKNGVLPMKRLLKKLGYLAIPCLTVAAILAIYTAVYYLI